MTGPDRRPGCLYVVLGSAFDHEQHSHVEPFVEVEDHEGRVSGDVRDFPEKGCRLLEFPDPAAHAALEAELERMTLKRDTWLAHACVELPEDFEAPVGDTPTWHDRALVAEAAHAALEAEVERLSDSLDGAKARYVSLVQAHTSLKEQKSRLIDELSGASLVMTGLEDRAKESEAAHAAAVEALERLKAWLEEPESCDVGFSRAAALAVVDAALAGKAPNIAGFSPDDAARAAFEAWWATTSWSNNLSFIESPGEEAAARAAWKAGRASMEGDAGKEVQP